MSEEESRIPQRLEETATQRAAVGKAPFSTPKRERWLSFGLLVSSIAVMCYMLKDAVFGTHLDAGRLAKVITPMLLSTAFVAWLFWRGCGKRKGLLIVSLVFAFMTLVYALNSAGTIHR